MGILEGERIGQHLMRWDRKGLPIDWREGTGKWRTIGSNRILSCAMWDFNKHGVDLAMEKHGWCEWNGLQRIGQRIQSDSCPIIMWTGLCQNTESTMKERIRERKNTRKWFYHKCQKFRISVSLKFGRSGFSAGERFYEHNLFTRDEPKSCRVYIPEWD